MGEKIQEHIIDVLWPTNLRVWCGQEKAYVTGLEAANRVVDHFQEGKRAHIIPVDSDESHVQELRRINKAAKGLLKQLPFAEFFM